jgi:hypothetical protein
MNLDCICHPCDNVATEGEQCYRCAVNKCEPGDAHHDRD